MLWTAFVVALGACLLASPSKTVAGRGDVRLLGDAHLGLTNRAMKGPTARESLRAMSATFRVTFRLRDGVAPTSIREALGEEAER